MQAVCPLCSVKTGIIIAKELRDGAADVFYCPTCDLGFLNSGEATEQLKQYYDNEYRKTTSPRLGHSMSPEDLFLAEVNFQNKRISLLRNFLSKDKRLLDVGCSSGMFLWHAKKYVGEVFGIDYDSRSAEYAAKKCACLTYTGEIEETDLEEGSLDIICAFQVLEHTKDPVDFIARHKKYLKPEGIFAIEVPNLNDVLLQAHDVSYYREFYYHKSHRWYFSAQSMIGIMDKCGFSGDVFFIQNYNILNHMNWIYRNSPQSDHFPGRSTPKFNLRDSADKTVQAELNEFIQKADEEYKNKLIELGMTDIFMYIGKIK